MGLLTSIAGWLRPQAADAHTRDPADDWWYGNLGAGARNHAGIRVTPDVALKASAVYACVKVLAETMATMPLQMYRTLPDGRGREAAPAHPLDEVIRYQPNSWQTAVEFWETMLLHGALRSAAYAEIVPGARGAVDQLIPLHSDRVEVEQLPSRELRFIVTNPHTGARRVLMQDEVFRIPGMSSDGVKPMRAVDLAAEAIGLGMAADAYAGRVFSNNLNIGVALVHPGKLTEEAQRNLIQALMARFAGAGNAHRPMVLQEGMKPETIGQTAEQAQLIEARKWQIGEIARYWRIPLHMLGIDDQTNRSTVEAQGQNLVRYTLRPWAKRIEQAIRRDLIVAPGLYEAKYNFEGLLRGDSDARQKYFSAALGASGRAAWMTPNEVRRIEGLNALNDPRADALGGVLPQDLLAAPAGAGQPAAALEDNTPPARAARLVRKEVAATRKAMQRFAGDAEAFGEWATAFFGGHVSEVMEALGLPRAVARAYCQGLARKAQEACESGGLPALLERWEDSGADEVVAAISNFGGPHGQDETA